MIAAISLALAGLGYIYFSDGQEPFTGNPDDNDDDNSGPDPNPQPDDSDDDNQQQGTAPNFNLPRVGGGSVRLSDLRGQVVVLDFMATWCGPCETELAHLDEIYNSYGSSQVRILSIDVDSGESESLLSQYIDQHDISWDVLMDESGINNAAGYDVSSIPTLVIVDQDGNIAYRAVGVTQASTLRAQINALL